MKRESYLKLLRQKNYDFIMYMFFSEISSCILNNTDFSKYISDYINEISMRYLLDSVSVLEVFRQKAINYYDNRFNTTYVIRDADIVGIF